MSEKSFGDQLLEKLTQKEKAELYHDFIEKYCSEAQAQVALAYNDREAAQLYLMARHLDDRRKAAERGGRVRSERKSRSSRENGRRGGRPRTEDRET